MKFLKIKLIITLLLYVVNISNKAYSLPIIADIDQRSINITSSFVGQELLIFGTTQYFGDIVIKVEGPKESFIVRKKKKH